MTCISMARVIWQCLPSLDFKYLIISYYPLPTAGLFGNNLQYYVGDFTRLLVVQLTIIIINEVHVIGHFTVVCVANWPWGGSEAGGDLVLIQTSLLFFCKCELVSTRTA